jgi:hypothetical protein
MQWPIILPVEVRLREGKALGSEAGKVLEKKKKTKLRGLSPQANYTDRATAACRRS